MPDRLARRLPAVPGSMWLQPLPPAGRFAFQGGEPARAAAAAAWGVELSTLACRAHVADSRAALWLGPDEYLLLDTARDGAGAAEAFQTLEQALHGLPHSLVDVSHRQFALEIRGPHAVAILSGACPLDLDQTAFPVGMCTRTVLAKAGIVLWRVGAEAFHVEAWRSYAGYVSGLLGEIAREYA